MVIHYFLAFNDGLSCGAVVKLKAFKDEYNDIVAELASDQSVIRERDDVTISHNMQQLQLWKKMYSRAVSNFREYERLTGIYGEDFNLCT